MFGGIMKIFILWCSAFFAMSLLAADVGTINRLPYDLDCKELMRDGSENRLRLSQMTFFREDDDLYLTANLIVTGSERITRTYFENLANIVALVGSRNDSNNVRYKVERISPNDNRLSPDTMYQVKLEIIGARGFPVDMRCVH